MLFSGKIRLFKISDNFHQRNKELFISTQAYHFISNIPSRNDDIAHAYYCEVRFIESRAIENYHLKVSYKFDHLKINYKCVGCLYADPIFFK